jgi:DNA polymerase III delta subunit
MNFNQWRNYAARGDVAKVTYICGDESTLAELVLDDIKNILQVPVTDYVSVDASQSDDIWNLASQYPLDPNANRLVVVRNAERINFWAELSDWLAVSRSNPKNFLVFCSLASDAPAVFAKGKKVSYVEHIELIRTKGKFIKCSQPNNEDLVTWCNSFGLSDESAEFLIQRTSGDTSAMLSVLKKVKIWNGSPNTKALTLLCQEQALDSLADYIILGEKKTAYTAVQSLDPADYAKVISRLDSRLDYMTDIYRCMLRRMYDVDIASTTGIKIFLIKKFKGVAKEYEPNKVKYRRQLITMIDGTIRDGAKVGVWETLITLW